LALWKQGKLDVFLSSRCHWRNPSTSTSIVSSDCWKSDIWKGCCDSHVLLQKAVVVSGVARGSRWLAIRNVFNEE
jgi:hypothetical protein